MKSFPEDHELIAFFEQEPEIEDVDVPWIYNNIIFRGTKGSVSYQVELYQACRELTISLGIGGDTIMSLSTLEVVGITLEENTHEAVMLVTFPEDSNQGLLKLRIKPSISIEW